MFRFFTILLLLGWVNQSAQAQASNYVNGNQLDFYRSQTAGAKDTKSVQMDQVDGSPYLQKDFERGAIYTKDKKKYDGIPLRYNIYNNEVEFKNEQDQVMVLGNPEKIDLIEWGPEKMVYRPYLEGNKLETGYFQVMVEGKVSLLKKFNIYVRDPEPAKAFSEPQLPKFIRKPDTYFIHYGTTAAQMIGSKKTLPVLFPDKNKEVETFIKKNKVKPNDPEKLQALLRYYNGM